MIAPFLDIDRDGRPEKNGPGEQPPGTPPLSASLVMTSLCSQIFISAEPSRLPLYPSSCARCCRAVRLELSFKSFIKSTIDCCQLSFWLLAAAIFLLMAPTSAGVFALPVAGAPPAVAVPWAGAPGARGANGVAPGAFLPKIAEAMLPQMLMIYPPSVNSFTAVAYVACCLSHATRRRHDT